MKAGFLITMGLVGVAATLQGQRSGPPRPDSAPAAAHPASTPETDSARAAPPDQRARPMSVGGLLGSGMVVIEVAPLDWIKRNTQRVMIAEGYTPIEPPYRSKLANRSDQMLLVRTRSPRAMRLQGTCDRSCHDLDLELVDEGGRVVAADNASNNTPVLEVQQGHGNRLHVRVVMNQCYAVVCHYQLMTFVRN